MGNNTEVLFGDDDQAIDIMDQQLIAKVLDLRTSHMAHLKIEQSKWALEVLKAEYCMDEKSDHIFSIYPSPPPLVYKFSRISCFYSLVIGL